MLIPEKEIKTDAGNMKKILERSKAINAFYKKKMPEDPEDRNILMATTYVLKLFENGAIEKDIKNEGATRSKMFEEKLRTALEEYSGNHVKIGRIYENGYEVWRILTDIMNDQKVYG